jgi:hypothetical protein
MIDGPAALHGREALLDCAVLLLVALVAGWLRGSNMPRLRGMGTVLLGLLMFVSMTTSWAAWRYGLMNATCTEPIDDRITGPFLLGLNAGLLITARVARATREWVRKRPVLKPEARSPKPSF